MRIPLSQLTLGFAICAKPVELAPCAGEILMTIDGSETRMSVLLPDGIQQAQLRFELRSCETISDHSQEVGVSRTQSAARQPMVTLHRLSFPWRRKRK
ncbi:MAG: hypothetical protein ABL921_00075 [Pirellula sp.]